VVSFVNPLASGQIWELRDFGGTRPI